MSELHGMGWYSSRVAAHLPKEAFKPVPARLWGGLAYLTAAVAGIAAIGWFPLPLWANLLVSFVIGMSFSGLGFLAHEILHGAVVKKAWLRDLLGGIAFAPLSVGPKLWRRWHNMEHHAHTQDTDHDPDAWKTLEEIYRRPLLRWVYRLPPVVRSFINFAAFSLFFSTHSLLMLRRYIGTFKPRDRVVVVLQYLLPTGLWLGLLAWMGPYRWLFAYLLPLLMANVVVISYIFTNHHLSPTTPVNDPIANSLSVTVPRWMDVLHYNFSYHVEHHLFPGMSGKWGPLVKEQVKKLWPDRYQEQPFGRALKALWHTPRVRYQDTDLVDPHRGVGYGTLGHGLDPANPRPHAVSFRRDREEARRQHLREHPLQGD